MQSLAALADPTRQRIVELLSKSELSSGQIAARFDITAPAISQHLKALKQARLVRARIDGQRRIYALDPTGFLELGAWLDSVSRFWQLRLDKLEIQLRKPSKGARQ